MSKLLFSVVNPIVKGILRSPFHGVMSRNTLLLEFRGRKSGRVYSMPVSYREAEGELHCFTDRNNRWWLNLRGGDPVKITLRGRVRAGKPSVRSESSPALRAALHDFLLASPRDASHAGVRFDSQGRPREDDLATAGEKLVLLSIDLQD